MYGLNTAELFGDGRALMSMCGNLASTMRHRLPLESPCTPDVRIVVASNMYVIGATRKWNGTVFSGVQTERGGSVVAA